MTLVIGYVCEDGIVMMADNEGIVQTEKFTQGRQDERKIRQVGRRNALALVGNATSAWGTVQTFADRYPPSKDVSLEQLVKELKCLVEDRHGKASDVRFVLAGYEDISNGQQRAIIYEIFKERENDATYVYREAQDGICYAGVEYVCYFLEQYLGRWRVNTVEQAKRAAAILIAATSADAAFGVGAVGSIAQITPQGCHLTTEGDEINRLRELGKSPRNSWAKCAIAAIVRGQTTS